MTKKKLSPAALNMIAERFKVLSEPIRLAILHRLQEGEASVNELTAAINTSQPNVSKHLKILQNAGILAREQKGNTVFYTIVDDTIFTLCELVCSSLETSLKDRVEILAQV